MKAFIGFGGFGGPEIALREAGVETISIEKDVDIANVARLNGHDVITADLLDIDPSDYTGYELAHFSPPCPRFSIARNENASLPLVDRISDIAKYQIILNGEGEMDILLSRKICEFIHVVRPAYFTLENVWAYRHSLSWLNIYYTLIECGYGVDTWNLNAADYGVPQSRRRMIVIARRDGRRPQKPFPTHSKNGDMFTSPWLGWYEAVEDLIPSLPRTKPAAWQIDRMPEDLKTMLVMTANTNRNGVDNAAGRGYLASDAPANTVNTYSNGSLPRAFIIGQGSRSEPKTADQPADTVTANSNQTDVKAFIIASQNSSHITVRNDDDPMFTVVANSLEKNATPKAFIIGGQYQTYNDTKNRVVQNRGPNCPIWTIRAGDHGGTRAWVNGYWVSITPRGLARFQDFPDWYQLPANRALACRGIGNALPPGVYRAICKSLEII